MTKQQKMVLLVIEKHIKDFGYPPTRAEIARKMGFLSDNAAQEHLVRLKRDGYITFAPRLPRSIRVIKRGK